MKMFKKKLHVKDWSNIKLNQIQEIQLLDPKDYENELDYYLDYLSILENKTVEELEELTPKQITELIEQYKFLNTIPKERNDKIIKINGKRFKRKEFNENNFAQMLDVEEYYKLGLIENMHKILAAIYLPVNKLYFKRVNKWYKYKLEWKINKYEPTEEIYKDFELIPMDILYGNILFFYKVVNVYMNNLKDYSMQTLMTEMKTEMEKMEKI